jgi:hypothetical protein
MENPTLLNSIFEIQSEREFNRHALAIYTFQYNNNPIYNQYCQALGFAKKRPSHYTRIPFLPIEFFKQHKIICSPILPNLVFTSSGTTGVQTSRHYIHNPSIYRSSFSRAFQQFFGNPTDYHILALLPSYLERSGSSLIYMVNELISQSQSIHSGFYINELEDLQQKIKGLRDDPRKILLLGVSFALLDMAELYPVHHPRLIVMETGGMKGKRKEMVRNELHQILQRAFQVEKIASEYGMTELLSQAYSLGNGIFKTPPWMKILTRETSDPLSLNPCNKTGGINVVDLANMYSCSFIATQDLGTVFPDGSFEISGRFDHSDTRGCNLLIT